MKLGFSTGCLYKLEEDRLRQLEMLKQQGYERAELMLHSNSEVLGLDVARLTDVASGFEYLSVHAPAPEGSVYGSGSNDEVEVIEKLGRLHQLGLADVFVCHIDWFDDLSIIKEWKFPVVLENSDRRKRVGKTVESIKEVLNDDVAGIVIDVNHIYSNDKSMKSLDEFLVELSDQVVDFHLSGFSVEEPHIPLHSANQLQIDDAIAQMLTIDVPIILEGAIESGDYVSELKKEWDYVSAKEVDGE